MAIHFFEEDIRSGLKDKRKLRQFLEAKIREYLDVSEIHINYIFCPDEALLSRNMQYLNHDTLTDIITFDLSETEDELRAEIYISVERVKENAGKFQVSYAHELHRVIFHGVLHLMGYKDKKAEEKQEMRHKEDLFLKDYGL